MTPWVTPATPGEEVLKVGQTSYWLVNELLGKSRGAEAPYLNPNHCINWTHYEPNQDDYWGSGLLVVRDGVFVRGPENWDSSG